MFQTNVMIFSYTLIKNRDMLQVKQRAVIQKKMKILQNSQRFQADHIIKFVSENM